MSITVCLAAKTLYYPHGGGHLWVYLNWAMGLRSIGCDVIWLEGVDPLTPSHQVRSYVDALKSRLEPYGLAERVALWPWYGDPLPAEALAGCLDTDAAAEADLLLNQQHSMRADLVQRFRRTALLDIDPGLTQTWFSRGLVSVAPHDVYFTIGETVGRRGSRFPDGGLRWEYTRPCVALDWWPTWPADDAAPFTTVTHWSMGEWEEHAGEIYSNDKRTGFLPFLELPRHTTQPLELAVLLGEHEQAERNMLHRYGWSLRDTTAVASRPEDYQRYIRQSRGEFSCAKPSCVRLQNGWISDRTICYLASGKPAVVQHTGPSRFLPDDAGLFRFHDLEGAARCLSEVAADYERQCVLARALADEHFDARQVTRHVLERALA